MHLASMYIVVSDTVSLAIDLTVDPTLSTLTLTNTIIQVCWNVTAVDDTVFENFENFTLTIVPMIAGVSVGQQSIVTVIDNDGKTSLLVES